MLIHLQDDGTLVGLPEEFQPARLLLPVRQGTTQHASLRIGQRAIELPKCLYLLFQKPARGNLQLSASWYHDRSILPAYLSIQLPRTVRSGDGYFERWTLLVDLESLRLMRVTQELSVENGEIQRSQEVSLDALCSADELKQLAPRPAAETEE